jgi:hypothetical protein
VAVGDLHDPPAKASQVGCCGRDIGRDLRPDLDLGPKELRSHLRAEDLLALLEDVGRRIRDEIARLGIDEQILLFDPDREGGTFHGHLPLDGDIVTIPVESAGVSLRASRRSGDR